MLLQAAGRFDLVDVEGVLIKPGQVWPDHATAAGHDQAIVAKHLLQALAVAVADTLAGHVDLVHRALDEVHAHGGKQFSQRRFHLLHIGFVEARTDAQFGLGGEHADADVVAPVLVQQASGAEGAPHTAEAGADDQDVLFHVLLRERRAVVCRSQVRRDPQRITTTLLVVVIKCKFFFKPVCACPGLLVVVVNW
ncbi:hypothetical protein D3C79_559970 [compost metagenome]